MTRPRKLTDEEVRQRLTDRPGWDLADGKLRRELHFDDFVTAFGFMTSVALAAEARNHHPEWLNVYNRVTVWLQTHDAGGISEKDFELAAVIDGLYGH